MRNKYNAVKQQIDGFTFDSTGEAARYYELKMMQRAGEIKDLDIHPKFILQKGFTRAKQKITAVTYRPDFTYYDIKQGFRVAEDFKGVRTEPFQIRLRLFLRAFPEYCFRITGRNGLEKEWLPKKGGTNG